MTAKRKIYIISTCFFVIFVVAIIFGITPLLKEIKKSSENLVFQKRALNLFQSQLVDLENFQKNYSLYQPTLERIEKSFVVSEAPIDFIEFLEREAQKSGLKIEISPLTLSPSETDPWWSTGFQISIGGPFPSCLGFLERLEQSAYLIEIFQLNIERIGEKGRAGRFEGLSPGDISFNIALKTFYED